jgi:hypothetical protein
LLGFLLAVLPARAHRLEPISTEFARPFAPGTGSLQVNYEYEHRTDFRTHLIPAAEFEIGLFPRAQMSVEMPLIWQKEIGQPGTLGGGHIEFGFRYLLAGGSGKSWAVSLNPFVEAPTGNRRIAGDATEVGAALYVDREFGERLLFHGNYGWGSTIGGSEKPERTFHYSSALVWPASHRWNPTLELLGEIDTATGRTELLVQPEMIYYVGPHWEIKAALPLGTTNASPRVGMRFQVSWIFGGRGSD